MFGRRGVLAGTLLTSCLEEIGMSGSGSWYDSGFGGINKEETRLAQMSGPRRLWIPGGATKEFVFVDDEPCCIYEHNPKMNGSWKNWFTCLADITPDDKPCCDVLGANTRYYCGFFTIVDCSEWVDKKGNKYQYEMKLLPAKLKSLKKFRRKKEERGSLVGCLFKAHREDDRSPSIGDEFEFVREVNMEKLFDLVNYGGKKLKELFEKAANENDAAAALKRTFQLAVKNEKPVPAIVPFNYFEVLKPMPSKELRSALGAAEKDDKGGEGDEGGKPGAGADDQVPF